ncbi:FBP domain-containing protein [Actinomadura yumaensis]|uniref:FBP domain-containing protein n=1 Tax=Actinomadura yumaensis TaxID=111807 RepID=UPI00361B94C9
MRPITESDIRRSFANCSKGEAKRLTVPKDLDERPWGDLDFLGWRDPGAPERLPGRRGSTRVVRARAGRAARRLGDGHGRRSAPTWPSTTTRYRRRPARPTPAAVRGAGPRGAAVGPGQRCHRSPHGSGSRRRRSGAVAVR